MRPTTIWAGLTHPSPRSDTVRPSYMYWLWPGAPPHGSDSQILYRGEGSLWALYGHAPSTQT